MKNCFVICLFVCALFCVSQVKAQQQQRYDNFCVLRAVNVSQTQLQHLQVNHNVDIWRVTNTEVDFMVHSSLRSDYQQNGFTSITLIENVQSVIDEQNAARSSVKNLNGAADWNSEYHTFESIVEETKRLAADHQSLVTYYPDVGTSIEGRSIVAVSLHGGPGITADGNAVPQIVILAGQHAREWIAPAATMYVLQQLVEGYGRDTTVTKILNAVNITIVPIMNPDGYDYSWTNSRLWRKNRRKNVGSSYYGVDLNRNWDSQWCKTGASKSPSSDTYCGTGPFSEPETKAMSDLITSIGTLSSINRNGDGNSTAVKLVLDMHAYSQLILRPYGYTKTPPPNNALLTKLGADMASLIRQTHRKVYENIAAIDLYPTTGSADDWSYDNGVPLVYTYELRDTGSYGFLLPASQIVATGQEVWAALQYLFYYVATNY
eukprot:TRINITY_DN15134_c0_g1_i1.p1 TRINITY_DN15134_c0_g1~~TRINITY_DN15134_c0_g1_i1.p1  ORF type:complete len:440 (-),score=72.59 TRINITY_DN15134_c0_g1_i1:13-1311(-)